MTSTNDQVRSKGKPILPTLRKGHNVPAIDEIGQWVERPLSDLDFVAQGLETPQLPQGYRSIDSVPQLWARAILFDNVLRDKDHPLHKQVLGEWRGLLAILALKELRSIPIPIVEFKVPHGKKSRFSAVVEKLLPVETVSDDTSWKQKYLIFYGTEPKNQKGTPIGMSSPLTLVCTASHLNNIDPQKITWFADGHLKDPIASLAAQERSGLLFWLTEVRDKLQAHETSARAQESRKSTLLGLFQAFITDLENQNAQEGNFKLSIASIGLTSGIYKYLDKPIATAEREARDSVVTLLPTQGYVTESLPTLLVLDGDLARQWDIKNLSDIAVSGTKTYASLDFAKLQDRLRLDNENLIDAQWRKPEDFFTDKLLLVVNREKYVPFEGALEINGQRNLMYGGRYAVPIPPLQPELLNYFRPNELAQRITIFSVNEETIRVELRIPLKGFIRGVDNPELAPGPRELVVRRDYPAEHIERHLSIPVLEIWPNFQSPTWNIYYICNDAAGSNRDVVFFGKPHWGPKPPDGIQSRLFDVSDSDRREITLAPKPPIAMTCTAFVKGKETLVGCLFLKTLPKVQPAPVEEWAFGVDFGRSASQVYVRKGSQGVPQPLVLPNRLFPITTVSQEARSAGLRRFLPSFTPEAPFLTLFRSEQIKNENHPEPFLNGNIRFVEPKVSLDGGALDREQVTSCFKMSNVQRDKELSEYFIQQLALHCLVEAAAAGITNLSWRVSYPMTGQKSLLKPIWEDIQIKAKQSGMNSTPAILETEAKTSALFFAKQDSVPMTSAICIDIGGGTSDISVWSRSNLLVQSSTPFAGEAMFMDIVKANPGAMLLLSEGLAKVFISPQGNKNFYPELDSYLRSKREQRGTGDRDDLLDQLRRIIDEQNPNDPLYGLLHLLALSTSGLIFYTGLIIRYLIKKGCWKNDQLPQICIGGNGARIFNWLSMGTFDRDAVQNRLFTEVFKVAAGIETTKKLNLTISSLPKAEAAFGLLVNANDIQLKVAEEAMEPVQFAGENFITPTEPLSWDSEITPELLAEGLTIPDELTQLTVFLESFSNYSKTKGSLVRPVDVKRYKEEIGQYIQQFLDAQKDKKPADIIPQPLFILSLKRLLELETKAWKGGWK